MMRMIHHRHRRCGRHHHHHHHHHQITVYDLFSLLHMLSEFYKKPGACGFLDGPWNVPHVYLCNHFRYTPVARTLMIDLHGQLTEAMKTAFISKRLLKSSKRSLEIKTHKDFFKMVIPLR